MTGVQDPFADFHGVIESLEEIRELIGAPPAPVLAKVMTHIDDLSKQIIEKSPFVVLASANGSGYPDVSPKGDPAGFVRVIGTKYLVIPDRPGNRRVDTFTNLLENPYLAVLFLIPDKNETLRVTGECRIVRDEALRQSLAVGGHIPDLAIVLHVERVFVHCPKCMVRSKLWNAEYWVDSSGTASIVQAMIAHAKLDSTPEELKAQMESAGVTRLY